MKKLNTKYWKGCNHQSPYNFFKRVGLTTFMFLLANCDLYAQVQSGSGAGTTTGKEVKPRP